MKKLTTIILSLLLALTGAALAEGPAWNTIEGILIEYTGTSLTLLPADGEALTLPMAPDALVTTDTDLLPGAYVMANLVGDAPSASVSDLSCFAVHGVVSLDTDQVDGPAFLVTDAQGVPYLVHCTAEELTLRFDGEEVLVYYSGMLSRSIPAQLTAQHIRSLALCGVIDEVTEDGDLLLTLADGEPVIVHVSEATQLDTDPAAGLTVRVATTGTMTLSLPAQYSAVRILPAE